MQRLTARFERFRVIRPRYNLLILKGLRPLGSVIDRSRLNFTSIRLTGEPKVRWGVIGAVFFVIGFSDPSKWFPPRLKRLAAPGSQKPRAAGGHIASARHVANRHPFRSFRCL